MSKLLPGIEKHIDLADLMDSNTEGTLSAMECDYVALWEDKYGDYHLEGCATAEAVTKSALESIKDAFDENGDLEHIVAVWFQGKPMNLLITAKLEEKK